MADMNDTDDPRSGLLRSVVSPLDDPEQARADPAAAMRQLMARYPSATAPSGGGASAPAATPNNGEAATPAAVTTSGVVATKPTSWQDFTRQALSGQLAATK